MHRRRSIATATLQLVVRRGRQLCWLTLGSTKTDHREERARVNRQPNSRSLHGDFIAYGDGVGYVVVWDGLRTFKVWQDGKLWQTFTQDVDRDSAVAMDVAREWIMANTFE